MSNICFVCENRYSNDSSDTYALREKKSGEIFKIKKISYGDRPLRLCPKCIRMYLIMKCTDCSFEYDLIDAFE